MLTGISQTSYMQPVWFNNLKRSCKYRCQLNCLEIYESAFFVFRMFLNENSFKKFILDIMNVSDLLSYKTYDNI